MFTSYLCQFTKSLSIDVVVHLTFNQFVEKKETFNWGRWTSIFVQDILNNFWRFSRFLNKWKDQSNNVRNHIPIFKLFGLFMIFCNLRIGTIVLILTPFPLLKIISIKLGHLRRFLEVKLFLSDWCHRSLDDSWRENIFIFPRFFMTVKSLNTVKRLREWSKPWSSLKVEKRRTDEVILNKKKNTIFVLLYDNVYTSW